MREHRDFLAIPDFTSAELRSLLATVFGVTAGVRLTTGEATGASGIVMAPPACCEGSLG